MDFTVIVADDAENGYINESTIIVHDARDQQHAEQVAVEAFAIDYWRGYNEANNRSIVKPIDECVVVAVFAGAHRNLAKSASHLTLDIDAVPAA